MKKIRRRVAGHTCCGILYALLVYFRILKESMKRDSGHGVRVPKIVEVAGFGKRSCVPGLNRSWVLSKNEVLKVWQFQLD
jgi:hypothetical protein